MINLKKINLIRQLGNLDCASACITMILNFHGYKCDISEISAMLDIGRDGVSLRKMKNLVEEIGFQFKAVHLKLDLNIMKMHLPFIAISKNNHYVVIENIKNNKIYLLDPEKGKIQESYKEFTEKYLEIAILISPEKEINRQRKKKKVLNINVDKKKVATIVLCMILGQAAMLYLPVITQNIVDAMYKKTDINGSFVLISIVGVGTIFYLASFIRKRFILVLQNNLQKDIAYQMIDKIFNIDMRFWESHSTGDIVNRINSLSTINDFLVRTVLSLSISLLTALICFGIMLYKSVILTICVVLITLMQAMVIYILNKSIKEKTGAYVFSQNRVQSEIFDALSNLIQIKSMGMKSIINANIVSLYNGQLRDFKAKAKASDLLDCFISTISIVTTILIYFFGYYIVNSNSMSVGELVAYIALVSYFINPIGQLALILPQTNMLSETINRIKEIMYMDDHCQKGEKRISEIECIKLDNVTYSYSDSTNSGVKNVSMNIRAGSKIAIVGLSGSGKTTLIKLIMNVVSNYSGNIFINDIPSTEIHQEDLFEKISVVTQTPFVLNDTIRKNVDILNEKSDEEVQRVLENVKLWDDIQQFPLGLNTLIGENGQNVSGGQKQRIAIARALIKNPEIVIFDEASSNLDPITEKEIYMNIKKMNLTQIIITHRMTTIKDADYIYVMQKGEIVESGTDETLKEIKSLYYKMCTI